MRYIAYLPGKPMHPVLRALAMVAGVGVLALLVIFGAVILLGLAVFGAIAWGVFRWRHRHRMPLGGHPGARPESGETLEGEYVVIERRDESR